MINTDMPTITTREMLRNHRKIFAQLKKAKQPMVVVNNKEPVCALVSIDLLNQLQSGNFRNSAEKLLKMAHAAKKLPISAPADLAGHHNEYAWD